MLYPDILPKPRLRGDKLDPVRQAAHLILPAAAGAHQLLHAQHIGVKLVFRHFFSDILENRLHTGPGQDAAGAKAGAPGNSHHRRGQVEASAQLFQNALKGNLLCQRKDAAGQKGRLVKGIGIKGIPAALQPLQIRKFIVGTRIRACQRDAGLLDPLHRHHHGADAVQLRRRVQHCAAVLIAVGRGVGPAAAEIHPDGKLHPHLRLCDMVRLIFGSLPNAGLVEAVADVAEALILQLLAHLSLRKPGQVIINPHTDAKLGAFRDLPQLFHLGGRDALASEDRSCLLHALSLLQRQQEAGDPHLGAKLRLPGHDLLYVGVLKAFLQAEALSGAVGSRARSVACRQGKKLHRRLHCFLDGSADRVKLRRPQEMAFPVPDLLRGKSSVLKKASQGAV